MREIEILREALTALKTMAEAAAGRKIYVPAIEALATLETEIARLRECALDLSGVPEGWNLSALSEHTRGSETEWWCDLYRSGPGYRFTENGEGLTPNAALSSAIGKIKG